MQSSSLPANSRAPRRRPIFGTMDVARQKAVRDANRTDQGTVSARTKDCGRKRRADHARRQPGFQKSLLIALSVEGGHISLVYPHWGDQFCFCKNEHCKTTSHGVALSSGRARHTSSWVARRARCFVTVGQDCSLHIAKFNIVSAAALHTPLPQRGHERLFALQKKSESFSPTTSRTQSLRSA